MFVGREAGLFAKNNGLTCKMLALTCISKVGTSSFSKKEMNVYPSIVDYFLPSSCEPQ